MADGLSFKVVGAEDVRRRLLDLAMKYRRKIVARAVRAAAKVLLMLAKALAPKGATGKLARFLKIRVFKPTRGAKGAVRIGVIHGTREEMGYDPKLRKWKHPDGREWFYPAHVEYGSKRRAAKPHLRPALRNNEERLIAVMGAEMEAGLVEAAKETPS